MVPRGRSAEVKARKLGVAAEPFTGPANTVLASRAFSRIAHAVESCMS